MADLITHTLRLTLEGLSGKLGMDQHECLELRGNIGKYWIHIRPTNEDQQLAALCPSLAISFTNTTP